MVRVEAVGAIVREIVSKVPGEGQPAACKGNSLVETQYIGVKEKNFTRKWGFEILFADFLVCRSQFSFLAVCSCILGNVCLKSV